MAARPRTAHETIYGFERQGYFDVDLDSTPQRMVFNRTVTLKDTWAKIEAKGARRRPSMVNRVAG